MVRLKQYFIDIADEASLWPANIINLGSIYLCLWRWTADPKKKERLAACPRGARKRGENTMAIVIFSDFPPINPITIYQANASL